MKKNKKNQNQPQPITCTALVRKPCTDLVHVKKTETAQPVEMIRYVELSQIEPSPFNPRTTFDKTALEELANSILIQGVLQPITLRLVGSNKYQIVCGERRYRACLLLNLKTVPAIVRVDISDEVAEEIAMIENLQREDLTELEETRAYNFLICKRQYDIKSLVLKLGKSETYIRNRLSLLNLIDEITEMLKEGIINFTLALELSRYSAGIQQDIFNKQFGVDVWDCWLKYSVKEIKEKIENNYCTKLSDYNFDKSDCLTCHFNSAIDTLFPEDRTCANCRNRECLQRKNTAFLVEKTTNLLRDNSTLKICRLPYDSENDATKELQTLGFAIFEKYVRQYPSEPQKPEREDYEEDSEYQEALTDYENEVEEYTDKMLIIEEQFANGKIERCLKINSRDVVLAYFDIPKEVTPETEQETAVEQLTAKEKRYEEIKEEKTFIDSVGLIKSVDMPLHKPFSKFEEEILFYFMLKFVRNTNFVNLGFKGDVHLDLDFKKKMKMVKELTPERKEYIKREFIVSHLKEVYRKEEQDLLYKFMEIHFAKDLKEIKKEHQTTFEKRRSRIQEKLRELTTETVSYEEIAELETSTDEIVIPELSDETEVCVYLEDETPPTDFEGITGDPVSFECTEQTDEADLYCMPNEPEYTDYEDMTEDAEPEEMLITDDVLC